MCHLRLCPFFGRFIALLNSNTKRMMDDNKKIKIALKDIAIFSQYSWQNPLITTLIWSSC
jgi:hypothetical protein